MNKKLKLNGTVQMMASIDYKERFKAEYLQLKKIGRAHV